MSVRALQIIREDNVSGLLWILCQINHNILLYGRLQKILCIYFTLFSVDF